MPDIHAVVDRIAAIASVNASKIRRTLLDQWLASQAAIRQLESADVTMVGEESGSTAAEQVETEESSGADVDLLRAVYLLQHPAVSVDDTAMTLINTARDGDVSLSQQVRAVRALFLLTDLATVHRLYSRTDWRDYFTALIYASELRRLRVLTAASMSSFEMADKSGLVRALCRCRDDAGGRVAACLAVDFRLSDARMWNAIVRRLTTTDVDVLLRPLPCRSGELTEAVSSLVMTWLNQDVVDVRSAVKVCLLLGGCATSSTDVIERCAVAFRRHSLPLCALTCVMMLPRGRGRGVVQLHDSIVALCRSMPAAVDAELAELDGSGHVLPTARRLLSVIRSH